MGEANLRCTEGETDDMIKLYMEVIRQAPTFAEPFQTFSMLYEISGDYEIHDGGDFVQAAIADISNLHIHQRWIANNMINEYQLIEIRYF